MRERKLSKTGHEQIDKEHNELIDMLNGLSRIISRRTEDETVVKLFENLIKLAEYHIKNEEQLMKDSKYPQLEEHVKEHELIVRELRILRAKLQSEILDFTMKFTLTNKNWLKHLYKHDKPLVKFLKRA
jgi:hemerythrin-like metal-binding protein